MANNSTDIELIRQVLHDDNARAFSVLMQRYSSQVYTSALRHNHCQPYCLAAVGEREATTTEPLDENIDLPTEDYDEQKEERIRSLETAVSQLPEQDRLIIEEHYYGNVPLAEIAHRLNQTENSIKVRLFRIREKLKATLVRN